MNKIQLENPTAINADGTTTVKTLGELGITEINLTADTTEIMLPDGRAATDAGSACIRQKGQVDLFELRAHRATRGAGHKITGHTTYTLANGTTRTVANATLMADMKGYTVDQVVTFDASGNRTTITKGFNTGGVLAFKIESKTNASGTSTTNKYDDNGDTV